MPNVTTTAAYQQILSMAVETIESATRISFPTTTLCSR